MVCNPVRNVTEENLLRQFHNEPNTAYSTNSIEIQLHLMSYLYLIQNKTEMVQMSTHAKLK